MKTAGIVLLCLQILAFIGCIANGSLINMFTSGVLGFAQLFGFCIPGIIGVILLSKAKKSNK